MTLPGRGVRTATIALLGCLVIASEGHGQQANAEDEEPTACVGTDAHRFDFWPGTWNVESHRRDRTGSWRETRNVWRAETVLGGCAFVDYADGDFGTGHLRGMGTRYFDPEADVWYISWMSTASPGNVQVWEGRFDASGRGEFISRVPTAEGEILSRILWWDVRRDAAEWEHAISRDGGETWVPTWRMTFRRAHLD